jgi:hypothetical protein
MKNILILVIVSMLTTSLSAQDLIITSFGDTIPCQIVRMDSISVTFEVVKKDGKKEGRILARMFVSEFRYEQNTAVSHTVVEDTVVKPEIITSTVVTWSKPETTSYAVVTRPKPEYTTFRWAFAPAGYAKRLSKIPEIKSYEDYLRLFKELTNSFSWESEMQFYLNKRNALALKVNGVHSSVEEEGGDISIPGFAGTFYKYKLKQRMIYVGPAWAQLYETNHFLFTSSLSLGALFFTETQWEHGSASTENEKLHSVAGAINYGIGGEVKVSPGCAIGLKLGVTLDSTTMFKISEPYFKSQIPVSWSSFNIAAYISFRN